MNSLADRIAFVLANCVQPDGKKWDAKALSAAAGLSPSHVNMIKNGRVRKPGGEVLAQIARAAHVSSHWLTTGEGQAFETPAAADMDDHSPRFASLFNWHALLDMARALAPDIPAWVWPIVAASHPLHTVPLTPGHVVRMARIVMELSPPPGPPTPAEGQASAEREANSEKSPQEPPPNKRGPK